MSYIRRRNSVHININGHRIRKDVFWRWLCGSAAIFMLVVLGIAWTFYQKDQVVHQAASQLMEYLFGR
ncbi:hypothetical protein [Cerasicoccus fimbriatus]|uniref:hypothetical protein n=1 Tax=Cerasicoccus fimbriatus TaxID=3014554 RepID=UPI0022B52377|nr:hypothetical protein [Cerasicoccus sp. TK19100]